jgi:hypothetical protein
MREIRQCLYGENGVDSLANALGIPAETWLNYERGITIPAQVLLDFLAVTGVDLNWLRTGDSQRWFDDDTNGRSDFIRALDAGTP